LHLFIVLWSSFAVFENIKIAKLSLYVAQAVFIGTTDWTNEQTAIPFILTVRLVLLWLLQPGIAKREAWITDETKFWGSLCDAANVLSSAMAHLNGEFAGGEFPEDRWLFGMTYMAALKSRVQRDRVAAQPRIERVASCLRLSKDLTAAWVWKHDFVSF
jgi:hypothetical protein